MVRDVCSAQKHEMDTTISVHISSSFNLQKQCVHPWQSHLFPHEYYFSKELRVPWSNGSLFMSVLTHWAYFSISVRNSTRKYTDLQNLTTTGPNFYGDQRLNMTLIALPPLALVAKASTTSFWLNPKRWVIRGLTSMRPLLMRSKHSGYVLRYRKTPKMSTSLLHTKS